MNLARELNLTVDTIPTVGDLKTNINADGAGLACGVFEHFLGLGAEAPKVLGATHFHEIFENKFLKLRPSLGFGHMEIREDMEGKGMEKSITYLYKYDCFLISLISAETLHSFRSGRSTSSFGNR